MIQVQALPSNNHKHSTSGTICLNTTYPSGEYCENACHMKIASTSFVCHNTKRQTMSRDRINLYRQASSQTLLGSMYILCYGNSTNCDYKSVQNNLSLSDVPFTHFASISRATTSVHFLLASCFVASLPPYHCSANNHTPSLETDLRRPLPAILNI